MLSHEFFHAITDQRHGGPGVRPLARIAGVTESSAYRWGRAVLTDEDPDATGAINPLDRFEAIVRMLASYPRARWILLRLEAWTRALFDQVLHLSEPDPADEAVLPLLAKQAKEGGALVSELLDGENDHDEDLRAALALQDTVTRLVRVLEARADHREVSPAMRRVG